MLGCRFAFRIVSVGGKSKADHAFVALFRTQIKPRQARHVSHNERQHSRCHGIEGTEVTDIALVEDPANAGDHVVRGNPRRFIDYKDTIH